MARVPASERTRKQIAEVLRGDFDKSALLRNAVRLIIEEALEAEVSDGHCHIWTRPVCQAFRFMVGQIAVIYSAAYAVGLLPPSPHGIRPLSPQST